MMVPTTFERWKSCWRITYNGYALRPLSATEGILATDRIYADELANLTESKEFVGSRFSDGGHKVKYVAKSRPTAIVETKYHRERFMRATNETAPMALIMSAHAFDLDGDLHTICGKKDVMPDIYHPTNYRMAQAMGKMLYEQDSNGIVYDSVRDPGGLCAAVFNADILANCRMEKALFHYHWDGQAIISTNEIPNIL